MNRINVWVVYTEYNSNREPTIFGVYATRESAERAATVLTEALIDDDGEVVEYLNDSDDNEWTVTVHLVEKEVQV